MYKEFSVKWSVSRGRETYGYNICTFSGSGIRQRCSGSGYDMLGYNLAKILMQLFPDFFKQKRTPEKLAELQKHFFGLIPQADGTLRLNGSYGRECVEQVATALLGVSVTWEYNRDRNGRIKDVSGVVLESAGE